MFSVVVYDQGSDATQTIIVDGNVMVVENFLFVCQREILSY